MKKQIAIALAAASMMFAAGETFTGTITDSFCEKGDHKAMNMGVGAKCAIECVKGMAGKYVLFDGKNSYELSDQKTPEKFAGKKVAVTGTLDAKTKIIKVEKMVAAAAK